MKRILGMLSVCGLVFALGCGGGDGGSGSDEGGTPDAVADAAQDMVIPTDLIAEDQAVVPECTGGVCDVAEELPPVEEVKIPEIEDEATDEELQVPVCGDGLLDVGEECDDGNTAPGDGCDEQCKSEGGEDCGDGECDKEAGECQTCQEDCGNCCGDGVCDDFEDCEFCPADCGGCAGDAFCVLQGGGAEELLCTVSLAAASEAEPKATGIQFKFSFDGDKVEFIRFHDMFCAEPDQCFDWDIPPQNTLQPSGHTVAYQAVGDGMVSVVIYHGSAPQTPVSEAWFDGDAVQGEAQIVELVFKVWNIDAGDSTEVEVYDMKATDKDATPLTMELDGAVFVTHQ